MLGRDPAGDVVLDHKTVSWNHCAVECQDDTWTLIDSSSRNGTFLAGERIRAAPLPVGQPVEVRLGDPHAGPAVTLLVGEVAEPATAKLVPSVPPAPPARSAPPAPPASSAPPVPPVPAARAEAGSEGPDDRVAIHPIGTRTLSIGRVSDNTVVVEDLLVSRHHATVRRLAPETVEVTDLGSRNGTFVNGRRVDRAVLTASDRLTIGRRTFSYDGVDGLVEHGDTGQPSLVAEHLSVRIEGTRVLSDVTFTAQPGTLLAIIGPSGAGKSTLLRALTGARAADDGRVLVDGIDFYPAYDEVRHRIGLVPQDDVLHDQLKVDQALRYAAALRLPDDVPAAARRGRVDSVLGQLDLTAQRGLSINRLSGGQRKRASVAMELLTEPSLLYLDEPTSGLDPLLDREVMRGLRDLADRRRTVVVVTHSTLYLHLCHQVLVLARGGRVAYFGPPDRLLAHFGAADYADVFTELSEDATAWAHRFTTEAVPVQPPVRRGPAVVPLPPRQSRRRQYGLLLNRSAALAAADRRQLALLAGLPLLLAAVVQTVPRSAGLGPKSSAPTAGAAQLLLILVIGAAFMGMASSVRELVGERQVYHREWAVGLRSGTYLAAKLTVNAVVCVAQAALLAGLGLLGRQLPEHGLIFASPLVELTAVLALTAFAASAAGLLASALVARTEHTMPILVISVMAQLVLSGGLFSIADRTWLQVIAVCTPTRWGYAAAAATVDLRGIAVTAPADALWHHRPSAWILAMIMLVVLTVAFTAGTLIALRVGEQRPRRRRPAAPRAADTH